MKKVTQEQQVIEVLRRAGGYATLRRLNELAKIMGSVLLIIFRSPSF